jgi:hypothetical protein
VPELVDGNLSGVPREESKPTPVVSATIPKNQPGLGSLVGDEPKSCLPYNLLKLFELTVQVLKS